jgi:hypothetical protein
VQLPRGFSFISRSCDLLPSSEYPAKPKEGLQVQICFRRGGADCRAHQAVQAIQLVAG